MSNIVKLSDFPKNENIEPEVIDSDQTPALTILDRINSYLSVINDLVTYKYEIDQDIIDNLESAEASLASINDKLIDENPEYTENEEWDKEEEIEDAKSEEEEIEIPKKS